MSAFEWLAILVACGQPASQDTPSTPDATTPFACSLAVPTEDGVAPLEDGGRLELVLGFQGFLFVVVQVVAGLDAPERTTAVTSLLVDGEQPVGSSLPLVELTPSGAQRVSGEIAIYLPNANVAAWRDREADLAIRLDAEDRSCLAQAQVLLVDDDPCIHTGEEPICPDDTGVDR